MNFSTGTQAAAPTGLRRDYLSFAEVFSQSVANIAPSATPALIVPLVYASARNGTWLSYLLATITMLLVAVHVNYFARHSSSPGSLYTFVSRGMGESWGAIAGWSLIIAYVFTGSAVLAGAANYATVLAGGFGSSGRSRFLVAAFMILAVAGAWAIAYKDVKLSTRSMLIVEFTSVGLILWLALAYLSKAPMIWDREQWRLLAATPAGIRQGMVLASNRPMELRPGVVEHLAASGMPVPAARKLVDELSASLLLPADGVARLSRALNPRINTDHNLCPGGIAIIPGSVSFAHA